MPRPLRRTTKLYVPARIVASPSRLDVRLMFMLRRSRVNFVAFTDDESAQRLVDRFGGDDAVVVETTLDELSECFTDYGVLLSDFRDGLVIREERLGPGNGTSWTSTHARAVMERAFEL